MSALPEVRGLPAGPRRFPAPAESLRPLPGRPDELAGRSCRRRGSLRAWLLAVDGAEDAPAAAAEPDKRGPRF